jgi:hypothetical protein
MLKIELAKLLANGNLAWEKAYMARPKSLLIAMVEYQTNPTEGNKKILDDEKRAWDLKQFRKDMGRVIR